MKRWRNAVSCQALTLVFVLAAAGCGNSGTANRTGNQSAGVNDVLEAGMAQEDNKKDNSAQDAELPVENTDKVEPPAEAAAVPVTESGGKDPAAEPAAEPASASAEAPGDEPTEMPAAAEGIDVDLTALSGTMVYSEVYSMMTSPDDYIGKTVKMKGMYSVYHDESTGKYYFACIIQDATACCAQGIEFELTEDYTYPEDYPQEGTEVCVVGVFDTYQEGDSKYATLREAQLAPEAVDGRKG